MRLTEKVDNEKFTEAGIRYMSKSMSGDIFEIINKLGEWEDLEEQGRLIELPCKVGDTIYHIMDDWRGNPTIRNTEFSFFWLDYEIFTTKEEAEAKLAELKGE